MKKDMKEYEYAEQFMKDHNCGNTKFPKFVIKIDGSSGIGLNYKVKCKRCKEEQDITDYGEW